MADGLMPEPFGLEGARHNIAAADTGDGEQFAVTLVLVDGSRIPAGTDTHAGIANMRHLIDARTNPHVAADEAPPSRTLLINGGQPEGFVVPASMIAYVTWSPAGGPA